VSLYCAAKNVCCTAIFLLRLSLCATGQCMIYCVYVCSAGKHNMAASSFTALAVFCVIDHVFTAGLPTTQAPNQIAYDEISGVLRPPGKTITQCCSHHRRTIPHWLAFWHLNDPEGNCEHNDDWSTHNYTPNTRARTHAHTLTHTDTHTRIDTRTPAHFHLQTPLS
jgi:hypothetical protein